MICRICNEEIEIPAIKEEPPNMVVAEAAWRTQDGYERSAEDMASRSDCFHKGCYAAAVYEELAHRLASLGSKWADAAELARQVTRVRKGDKQHGRDPGRGPHNHKEKS